MPYFLIYKKQKSLGTTYIDVKNWLSRIKINFYGLTVKVRIIAAIALVHVVYTRKAPPIIAALTGFNFLAGRSTLHLVNDVWYWFVSARRV